MRYKNVGEGEKSIVHGGYGQFLTKKVINLFYDQISDERFLNSKFMYRNTLVSVDKILSKLAFDNSISLVDYDANINHYKDR